MTKAIDNIEQNNSVWQKENQFFENYFFELIFSVFLIISFMAQSNILFWIILIIYTILAIKNISKGLTLFIIILPFNEFLNESIQFFDLNAVFTFTLILTVAFILNNFQKNIKINKISFIFIMLLLVINLISLTINLDKITFLTSYYGMLVAAMLYVLIYINAPINNKKLINNTFTAITISAINIAILVMYQYNWNLFAIDSRVEISGLLLIKSVAYYLAAALIITFYRLYYSNKNEKYINKIKYIFLLLGFMMFLIFSGSRGVFFSTITAIIVVVIADLSIKKQYAKLFYIIILIVAFLVALPKIILLMPEFTHRLFGTERDIRLAIWLNGIKQLNFIELIFGRGLNRFQDLSLAGGYVTGRGDPFHAHSLYLDILTSNGIFALIMFIVLLFYLMKEGLKYNNVFIMGYLIYLVIIMAVGLSITNTFLWIQISLLFVITLNDKDKQQILLNEKHKNTKLLDLL